MNYEKIYTQIINRSKLRILNEYTEKHHILPVCMGGNDDISNIAILTPEEHYVCHQILVKIHPKNRRLLYAARMMATHGKNLSRSNNKLYGWLKRKYSKENLYYRSKTTLTCDICGCKFERLTSTYNVRDITSGTFCGQSCVNKGRRLKDKRIECSCIRCNTSFKVTKYKFNKGLNKFCSRICSNLYHSTGDSVTKHCLNCNSSFTMCASEFKTRNGGKYCSYYCQHEYRRLNKN